jgi:hypothetical protein
LLPLLLQEGKVRRRRVWAQIRSRLMAGFLSSYFCALAYAAWVVQQPAGTYAPAAHAKRIAPVFLGPALTFAVHALAAQVHALLDRRADKQIAALQTRLRKTVADLKDSTRFQRTQALLQKYDPDYAPPAPPPQAPGPGRGGPAGLPATIAGMAASAAGGVVSATGARVSSAVGQLWDHMATSLIAVDPALVHMLQQAQQAAEALERENAELRRRLGLPPRGAQAPPAAGPPAPIEPAALLAGAVAQPFAAPAAGGDAAAPAPPEPAQQLRDQEAARGRRSSIGDERGAGGSVEGDDEEDLVVVRRRREARRPRDA